MKYEMIFGDEKLFDGAPEDCFCVAKNVYDENVYYKAVDACLFWLDGGKWKPLQFMSCTPIAMRRIIKEPKRWTWEDKKAGRLPEVGAELIHKTKGICYFVGVGLVENACWALKLQSGLIYIAEKSWCSPIETPSEKAKREEDALFLALKDEWQNPKSPPISSASFEVGVRAAYRKLKGGE